MEASFKSDAKSVKVSSKNLQTELGVLKNQLLNQKLKQFDELDSTVKLIEQLSILNEYKLNLFKDFSSYKMQKK